MQSLKHIRIYVGYTRMASYVPHATVKCVLTQQYCLGSRGKWVTKIQEYDSEIKPTKLIKGQGLSQIIIEGNHKALGMNDKYPNMIFRVIDGLEQHAWYL